MLTEQSDTVCSNPWHVALSRYRNRFAIVLSVRKRRMFSMQRERVTIAGIMQHAYQFFLRFSLNEMQLMRSLCHNT